MSSGTRDNHPMDGLAESDPASLRDEAPDADAITAYDEAHFGAYLQLLYGTGEGHSLAQLAREAFDIDADKEPERAKQVVSSHLRRAQWMCASGSHHFL